MSGWSSFPLIKSLSQSKFTVIPTMTKTINITKYSIILAYVREAFSFLAYEKKKGSAPRRKAVINKFRKIAILLTAPYIPSSVFPYSPGNNFGKNILSKFSLIINDMLAIKIGKL